MQETTQGITKVAPHKLAELFAKEVEIESRRTAKYLERLPLDKFNWAPHEKSMNLGKLSGHITDLFYWFSAILERDGVDLVTDNMPVVKPESPDLLLNNLKKNTEISLKAIENFDQNNFNEYWTLSAAGNTIYHLPKHEMFRMEISHLLHHRGQLSLYLRMLDVPLPNVYGPTADEQ